RSLGMSVEQDLRFDPEAVPMSVRSALHRVLQEATTNAAKHAGAGAEVRIMVAEQGRDVVLEVENTVAAPQRSMRWNSSGVGLQSMRDRVATFGGTLEPGR
ncbi:two-component sensor histidine kinase, partial [Micrococcus endophyticus]